MAGRQLEAPSTTTSVPPPSIVRYEEPVLLQSAVGDRVKRTNVRVDTHGVDTRTVELLDRLLPPVEYRDGEGNVLMRYVSRAPATRLDSIATQEALDAAFIERQARTVGVCSVREELYSQTFDEVIRQVTLRLPERGLALLRVRDQLRMTLAGYRTLYNSSAQFGASKATSACDGMPQRSTEIDTLTTEIDKLKAQKLELERVCQAAEASFTEQRSKRLAKQQQEREALLYQNSQLQTFVSHADTSRPSAQDLETEADGGDSGDEDGKQ